MTTTRTVTAEALAVALRRAGLVSRDSMPAAQAVFALLAAEESSADSAGEQGAAALENFANHWVADRAAEKIDRQVLKRALRSAAAELRQS